MHKIKKHAHKKTKQNENGIQPLQICAGGKKKKKKKDLAYTSIHSYNKCSNLQHMVQFVSREVRRFRGTICSTNSILYQDSSLRCEGLKIINHESCYSLSVLFLQNRLSTQPQRKLAYHCYCSMCDM